MDLLALSYFFFSEACHHLVGGFYVQIRKKKQEQVENEIWLSLFALFLL